MMILRKLLIRLMLTLMSNQLSSHILLLCSKLKDYLGSIRSMIQLLGMYLLKGLSLMGNPLKDGLIIINKGIELFMNIGLLRIEWVLYAMMEQQAAQQVEEHVHGMAVLLNGYTNNKPQEYLLKEQENLSQLIADTGKSEIRPSNHIRFQLQRIQKKINGGYFERL